MSSVENRIYGLEDVTLVRSRGRQTVRTTWYWKLAGATEFTVIDWTGGTSRVATLVFRQIEPSPSASNDFTRTSTTAAEADDSSGASGIIDWLFESNESVWTSTTGTTRFRVAARYADGATPAGSLPFGTAIWTFVDDWNA